jgi:hypothetical protein
MDALQGRGGSVASSSNGSSSTVDFEVTTVQELTDVLSAALADMNAAQSSSVEH